MIMQPNLYDIFDANVTYRNAHYRRPGIIVRNAVQGRVTVALISSALELYKGPHVHFKIEVSDPNFRATGLKKDCYVSAAEYVEIEPGLLLRKRGQLEGELLQLFKKWIE